MFQTDNRPSARHGAQYTDMNAAEGWDSDKENMDPNKGNHKSKRTRKGKKLKKANYPVNAAAKEHDMGYKASNRANAGEEDEREIEAYIEFKSNSDAVLLKAAGPEVVQAYRSLFRPSLPDPGTNYNSSVVAALPGETARWWKMVCPGYNTREIWSVTWQPTKFPDYMERRWDIAHQFMNNERKRTETAERRRATLIDLYNGDDPQAGFLLNLDLYRVNKPQIPTILPPIYRVCPVTGNWYPTINYQQSRDPFIIGFDMFYPSHNINKIFRFDSLPHLDQLTYSEDDIEFQRLRMMQYQKYDVPYCLGSHTDPDKPELILTPVPYVSMGSRGPWRMIPTDTDSDQVRETRARQRFDRQTAKAKHGNKYVPEINNRNPSKFQA